MKEGTRYGARLKKAYAKLRQGVSAPPIPELDEPLRRLMIGIIGVSQGDDKAERAVDALMSKMVDWNEVRISSAHEIVRAMGGGASQGGDIARRIVDALQYIFQLENRLSLDRLKKIGRREAREYLERITGADDYAVASVLLWSLGGHAVPVDDRLLQELRAADLVHPSASRSEVQAFLERHVSAADAREFCLTMRSFSANTGPRKKGAATSGRSAGSRTRKKAAT
jgi:hypothetical protein